MYGNPYHDQSWKHLGMWLTHHANCAHPAEVQNAAKQMYSSLFYGKFLLTSKGYRTTIKLEFLLKQTKSRNTFMSTVHKGKRVYHIKTLRLEVCFVISLQANPCIWEKKKACCQTRYTGGLCNNCGCFFFIPRRHGSLLLDHYHTRKLNPLRSKSLFIMS